MDSESFGSCLEHHLEHIGHGVGPLTKSVYFKGNLASLAMCHPIQLLWWTFFLYTQSAIFTEVSVARAHTWARTSLPDCQEVSVPYEPGHRRQ